MSTPAVQVTEADKVAVGLHANSTDLTYPLILCALAAKNDTTSIKAILDLNGVNPSASDYDGRTPLHIACDEGHLETVKLLVERGADVNSTDRWGNTPLLCAFMRERMQIVTLLKEKGAKLRVLSFDERIKDIASSDDIGAMEELKHLFDKMGGGQPCDFITTHQLETALEQRGLDVHKHQVLKKEVKQLVGKDGKISWTAFQAAFTKQESLIERALLNKLVVHDWDGMKKYITELFDKLSEIKEGKNADYIPELGSVDPDLFGVAICTVDGQVFTWGDTDVSFPIQSCGKPLLYSYALEDYGEEHIHRYVGREPSGASFNAFTLNYQDKPHNACINAGAIAVSAIYHPEVNPSQRFKFFSSKLTSQFGMERPGFGQAVYLSEKDTAHANFALAHFMAARNSFPTTTPINDALDFYFQVCSTEANVRQIAIAAATYANNGICPLTGDRVLKANTVKRTLQLLFSCGMYDYSGEWACTVGLPAKSGVSGIIYVVVPDVLGMAIFSPPLDRYGNSVKGVRFATSFTEKYNYSLFDVVFRKRDEVNLKSDNHTSVPATPQQ